MNKNNASLKNNQVNDFTLSALEVMLKLLNGYELIMADQTPSNISAIVVKKGINHSTYVRQNLIKTNDNRLMAFAKAQAPMSEADKLKQAMAAGNKPAPEVVKLANGVLGNYGAHAHFLDLYESGQYLRLLETVCSFATPERMAHAQQQLAKAQLPFLDGLFKEFAQKYHKGTPEQTQGQNTQKPNKGNEGMSR